MKVNILNECGLQSSMLGLGLSHGLTSTISYSEVLTDKDLLKKLEGIANVLYRKDGGHNKFLESIVVWIDILAPRYWWQEFDTYRVGMTKQSESTIHTIAHKHFTQDDFERGISESTLNYLNKLVTQRDFIQLKAELPEGFLQRRIVCTNYKALRTIIIQRRQHKLIEWRVFVDSILEQARCPFLNDLK